MITWMELAYIPFRDPLTMDRYWMFLLLPLVAAIAVVYKAIKLDDLSLLPRQAFSLGVQIVGFMAVAAIVLWTLTELL